MERLCCYGWFVEPASAEAAHLSASFVFITENGAYFRNQPRCTADFELASQRCPESNLRFCPWPDKRSTATSRVLAVPTWRKFVDFYVRLKQAAEEVGLCKCHNSSCEEAWLQHAVLMKSEMRRKGSSTWNWEKILPSMRCSSLEAATSTTQELQSL